MGTSARLPGPAVATAAKRKKDKNSVLRSHSSRLRQLSLRPRRSSARVFASGSSLNPLGRPPSFSSGSVPSSVPSPARSFFVGSWEDDEDDDSSYLNALCYPDAVLDEQEDDVPERPFVSNSAASLGPIDWEGEDDLPSRAVPTNEAALVSQNSLIRRGATAAVLQAEENYRRAWRELQLAERRLLSTRQVASELNALPRPQGDQSVDIPILPSVALPLTGLEVPQSDFRNLQGSEAGESSPTVDLGFDDGVWCIEACTTEPDSPRGNLGSSATFQDALLDAEGAMSRSRVAVDCAARDLIARLHEEEDLHAEVIDRHIEALDQGAQHQVARWLVEEMESLFAKSSGLGQAGPDVGRADASSSLSIAVPLNLDLAMQGYDEHAVRFLRHLPYDQVMKIKTIPPTPETKSLVAVSAAADDLERILSQPAGQPAADDQQGREREQHRGTTFEVDLVEGSLLPPVVGSGEAPLLAGQAAAGVMSSGGGGSGDRKYGVKGRTGKYHSKLVLLGCCVCSLAAYMVANFDLAVLAKDVAVILTAMSLALIAAQFVWRSGDSSDSSEGEDSDDDCLDMKPRALPGNAGGLAQASGRGLIRGRGPSWDQVIWLLGGFAVVLSLSTMVALACKAAQAGLTALSTVACTFLIRIIPSGAGAAAASLLPARASAGLVRQVTSSLWLVLGGELLSTGVESLGSAAAWAMLLLCVAFSIASAPVCIASSTSRRVNELLALARSRSPSKSS